MAATVGRVEHMVQDARESVSEAGTSIIDTIKQNPIPAALIGVGIGWLLFGGNTRPAARARVLGASHLVDGAQSALNDAREAVNHFAHDASDRIGGAPGDARQRGEQLARGAVRQVMRAERGAESLLRDNPVAVGAVALA